MKETGEAHCEVKFIGDTTLQITGKSLGDVVPISIHDFQLPKDSTWWWIDCLGCPLDNTPQCLPLRKSQERLADIQSPNT